MSSYSIMQNHGKLHASIVFFLRTIFQIIKIGISRYILYSVNFWQRKTLVNLANYWWFAKFYHPNFKNTVNGEDSLG